MYGDGALKPQHCTDTQKSLKVETSEPDRKLQTWGTVVWQGDIPEGIDEEALKAAEWIGQDRDDHHGILKVILGGQTFKFTVQQKSVAPAGGQKDNGIIPGDGTVPRWSAAAQGRGLITGSAGKANGVQMVFVQGGYEHQFCFDHSWTRWATLYSMAQIAHKIEANAG
jgi:hypothetical protein